MQQQNLPSARTRSNPLFSRSVGIKGVDDRDWVRKRVRDVLPDPSDAVNVLRRARRVAGVTGLFSAADSEPMSVMVGDQHGVGSNVFLIAGDIRAMKNLRLVKLPHVERRLSDPGRMHLVAEVFSMMDTPLLNSLSVVHGPEKTLTHLKRFTDEELGELSLFIRSAMSAGSLSSEDMSTAGAWDELLNTFDERNSQPVGFVLGGGLAVNAHLDAFALDPKSNGELNPMSGAIAKLLLKGAQQVVTNQHSKVDRAGISNFRTSNESLREICQAHRSENSLIATLEPDGMVLKVVLKQMMRPDRVGHKGAMYACEDPKLVRPEIGIAGFRVSMSSNMTSFPDAYAYQDFELKIKAKHPNVGSSGNICLGNLGGSQNHWSEAQFRGHSSTLPTLGDLVTMLKQMNMDSPFWGRNAWEQVVTVKPDLETLLENMSEDELKGAALLAAEKMSPDELWGNYGPAAVKGFRRINSVMDDMAKLLERF